MSHSRLCERGRNASKSHRITQSGSIMSTSNPNLQTYTGSRTSKETTLHVLALDRNI
jgi:hypothetical protein